MTPLLAAVTSAIALGVVAPPVLARVRHLDDRPRLAAHLWLCTTIGSVFAILVASLIVIFPNSGLATDLAMLLRTCLVSLRDAFDPSQGGSRGALRLAAFTVLASVAAGLLGGGVVSWLRGTRAARLHRELLSLAGSKAAHVPGLTVLSDAQPFAYCLPTGPVVVSSGALEGLNDHQLAAVLAHERAHQQQRHHRFVLLADALGTGFPWLPAARLARCEVRRLVELAADDAAAQLHGPETVAAALLSLEAPIAARALLAAGGRAACERAERLLRPARGGQPLIVAATMLVALPLGGALLALGAPLIRIAGCPVCPIG